MKNISLVLLFVFAACFVSKAQTTPNDACKSNLDSCTIQKDTLLRELNNYKLQYEILLGVKTNLADSIPAEVVSGNCEAKLEGCNKRRKWLMQERNRFKKLYEETFSKINGEKAKDSALTAITATLKKCETDLEHCLNDNKNLSKEMNNYKTKYEALAKKEGKKDKQPVIVTPTVVETEVSLLELTKKSERLAKRHTSLRGKKYDIYVIDTKKNTMQLFLKDERGSNYSFDDVKQIYKEKLTFAMNAGMYHPDGNTVGLYVANGKEITPLNTQKLEGNFYMQPNGVFALTKKNEAFILATEDYAKAKPANVLWATQSGPMLLNKGEINANFKEASPNVNIRNGVGVMGDNKIIFVISNEKVNFYEFADLFKTEFGCQYALYLDGVVSQMYLPELKRTQETGRNLGPIITVIR